MKHIALAILGAALLSSTAAATTMQEAVSKAVTSHPQVLAAEKNRNAIGYQIDMARAGYKPTLDMTLGSGWENSTNPSTRFRSGRFPGDKPSRDLWRNEARLVARQMIYDGFQTTSRVAQQKNRFTSAVYNVSDVKNAVALRTIEAYLNVLRTREQVALAEENVTSHQQYVSRLNSRLASGRSAQADVRQAEGRLALAIANVEAAKGEAHQAEADYLESVGEMPNNPSKDATPFGNVPANTRAAVDRAMTNSPVIASAMADIKAANAELAESKSPFCPRVELEGGVSNNVNLDGVKGLNNDRYAMVYVRQNLYRGGYDVAQRKERTERVKEAQDQLERERRLVEMHVIDAYSQMETARARLNPLTSHVESAQATRDAYVAQFDLGQRSLLDLLDSEVELFNSRSALINGKYETDLAAYGVLAHMGDLVPAGTTQVASK